ncbi:thioredoxin-dependent thiol peroxidase [Bacteroidales bacterium OttesenSCG-928-C19]|nr:thioredoxin-dependent thiol peroxidase [Bacteroidales bacterium OttesenSCG-928-C19]
MTHLKKGDKAPQFNGIDQNGNIVDLEKLEGKKVILYFYPKDNTPGCTAEACNLRDNDVYLQKNGFEIIGVSADSEVSHKKFAEKNGLTFPLIADTEKEIVKLYGVWGPKKFMGKTYDGIHRTTFIISEDGIILEIIEKVDTKNHVAQILELMNIE